MSLEQILEKRMVTQISFTNTISGISQTNKNRYYNSDLNCNCDCVCSGPDVSFCACECACHPD